MTRIYQRSNRTARTVERQCFVYLSDVSRWKPFPLFDPKASGAETQIAIRRYVPTATAYALVEFTAGECPAMSAVNYLLTPED